MKTIRSWSVLDCRTDPASVYHIVVLKLKDQTYAMCKKSMREGKRRFSRLYNNPEAPRNLCMLKAVQHIHHLNQHSCIVHQIKLANSA